MPAVRRIGVFGGAFDPPHNGHVALVRAAAAQLQLDELRVLPTGQAWHKPNPLSPAAHRLAMARLAFEPLAGPPQVVVDDREMRRPGPTYTVDTLRELQAEQPHAQLHLIMGADQAAALTQWHQWQEILQLAIISIADRAPVARTSGSFDAQNLPGARYEFLQLPPMPVSATQVRELAARPHNTAQGIAQLVPDSVARYIERHHLYLTA